MNQLHRLLIKLLKQYLSVPNTVPTFGHKENPDEMVARVRGNCVAGCRHGDRGAGLRWAHCSN